MFTKFATSTFDNKSTSVFDKRITIWQHREKDL